LARFFFGFGDVADIPYIVIGTFHTRYPNNCIYWLIRTMGLSRFRCILSCF
jgi:hypothetical protein